MEPECDSNYKCLAKRGPEIKVYTRDLKWGVPVPHEKYKEKVRPTYPSFLWVSFVYLFFCVWFDAPIGYVSITSCYTSDWEKWWKNPENVELYQFMGKDNVPFHIVMFPSTFLGTEENWTLMKTTSVTEYSNYEAGKFSKSKGIGVFGNDAKDTKIPSEVWRYYLLTNRSEDLQAKLNNELLANLGNFINRVLSFIAKPSGLGYGSVIPDAANAESHPLTKALAEKIAKNVEQYVEAMEKVKLKQGLKISMSISSEGNCYLQVNLIFSCILKNSAEFLLLFLSLLLNFHLGISFELSNLVAYTYNQPKQLWSVLHHQNYFFFCIRFIIAWLLFDRAVEWFQAKALGGWKNHQMLIELIRTGKAEEVLKPASDGKDIFRGKCVCSIDAIFRFKLWKVPNLFSVSVAIPYSRATLSKSTVVYLLAVTVKIHGCLSLRYIKEISEKLNMHLNVDSETPNRVGGIALFLCLQGLFL
ncbi:hypothetical protein MKW94_014441 [Papaver nudicaule]|uniref:methionine--tRNA ligase n=1 Tax=Papaver nudicaule TaxID=74823 RepID=A0AA41S340_PAPNU|nr:hypothetical protein [Papaver nudicaule]